ncbi:MAG: hypothetical protein ACI8PT_003703 [Gammaproteobacteria bacterium]|jgi:hypothetical protein
MSSRGHRLCQLNASPTSVTRLGNYVRLRPEILIRYVITQQRQATWALSPCAHQRLPYSATYRTRLTINQSNELLPQLNVRRVPFPLPQRSEGAEPSSIEMREARLRDYVTGQLTRPTQAWQPVSIKVTFVLRCRQYLQFRHIYSGPPAL